MKRIFKLVKKIIMVGLIMYAYNLFAVSIDAVVPINIFTILIVTILGLPSLLTLVLLLLFIF